VLPDSAERDGALLFVLAVPFVLTVEDGEVQLAATRVAPKVKVKTNDRMLKILFQSMPNRLTYRCGIAHR
jgi:hypothetical protein